MSNYDSDAVHSKLIYVANLNNLSHDKSPYDISSKATARRYRLVECVPLVKDGTLRIHEYTELPSEPYTVVSYVWRGNKPLPGDKSPTFTVQGSKGLLAGDPINIQVLQDTCRAAIKRNTNLLWLDRLSTIQSSNDELAWQLTKIYDIYRLSTFCVVIPGGFARLTGLREETPWIHSGWTLQEAVAPPAVEILFLWESGGFKAKPSNDSSFTGYITEVSEGRCAMAPLSLLLDSSISGSIHLVDEDAIEILDSYDGIAIFGVGSKERILGDSRSAVSNIAMLAAVLSKSMEGDYDQRCHCLWKCILMRSTRNPADRIFSVMGMFGVTLNPKDFDVNDYIGPAIALAQEIMKKGGRANWLGIALHTPPCAQLSTFPTFPKPSEDRDQKALIRTPKGYVKVLRLMNSEYPISGVLRPMPKGEMDVDGYLLFSAKSVPVISLPTSNPYTWHRQKSQNDLGHIKTTYGDIWHTTSSTPSEDRDKSGPRAFAMFLGCLFPYRPTETLAVDYDNIRGFVIKEHSSGKYHVNSYFVLNIKAMDRIVRWKEHQFCIGGPDKLEAIYVDELLAEVDPADIINLPPPDIGTTFARIDSVHTAELTKAARLNQN